MATVWITRTEPGASRQARELEAAGHRCIVAPVLQIEPLSASAPAGPFDAVIFVSEHAVRCGLPRLQLGNARCFAVGARTAAAMAAAGQVADYPDRADSEGLLALPAFARVAGQRILLVCGEGGRNLIADELSARGARVVRWACYRRRQADTGAADVSRVGVIVAGSGDGLEVIARLWFADGGRPDIPLLVPSSRVQDRGVALGFRNVHDCGGADTVAVLRGLAELERTGLA